MDVSPTPRGVRIVDRGDCVLARVGPSMPWAAVAVLTLWTALWTAGGVASIISAIERPATAAVPWLVVWLPGEVFAICMIAWYGLGRVLAVASPERLVVVRELGPYRRERSYPRSEIDAIDAARVVDHDGEVQRDWCVTLARGASEIAVGEGMTQNEALQVASALAGVLRVAAPRVAPAVPAVTATRPRWFAALLFPAGVVALLVWLALHTHRHPPQETPARAVDATAAYAQLAATEQVRAFGLTEDEMPGCAPRTVAVWTCGVRAHDADGGTHRFACSVRVSGEASEVPATCRQTSTTTMPSSFTRTG